MKQNQMTARELRAFQNIKYASYDLIGGLENTLMDYDEASDEYKNADEALHNHQGLVEAVYMRATTMFYRAGYVCWGPQAERLIRDINFLGRAKLMDMCDERVCKEGY